jgi:hypothetical protein
MTTAKWLLNFWCWKNLRSSWAVSEWKGCMNVLMICDCITSNNANKSQFYFLLLGQFSTHVSSSTCVLPLEYSTVFNHSSLPTALQSCMYMMTINNTETRPPTTQEEKWQAHTFTESNLLRVADWVKTKWLTYIHALHKESHIFKFCTLTLG